VLTLETKRLMLKQVQEKDLNVFKTLLQNPFYLRHLPQKSAFSDDDVELFMQRRIRHWRKGVGSFVIYLKAQPHQAIGFVGVESSPNPLYSDLRFMIIKKYQSKGYAFEASAKCVDFVFKSKLESQIYGVCLIENLASANILKKLGMTQIENLLLYQTLGKARQTYKMVSPYLVVSQMYS
jgi:ribosomal-protein-alanine N-acetyltransferase